MNAGSADPNEHLDSNALKPFKTLPFISLIQQELSVRDIAQWQRTAYQSRGPGFNLQHYNASVSSTEVPIKYPQIKKSL